MIMRCTRSLLNELNDKHAIRMQASDSFWNCHANMFKIEGKKCILITNDLTLFTIFIPQLNEHDIRFFDLVVCQHFLKNLLYENIPHNLIKQTISNCERMGTAKTSDRRVLFSLNRLRKKLEHIVWVQGGLDKTDYYELNSILNRVNLKNIDYKRPIDVLKQKLNFTSPADLG